MKGRLCLTNLIALSVGLADSINDGRTTDIFHLHLSQTFNMVSHHILIDKLERYRLDEWTTRWIKNWLDCHTQRIVPTVGRPVTSGIPQGLILKPILFNIFNNSYDGV